MNFNDRVYELCKKIPKGKVSTYRDIAHALGSKVYRAVGNALNKNHRKDVPCHRVVGTNGHLTGFAHGIDRKKEMLEKEGVIMSGNKVNLQKSHHKLSAKIT